MESHAKEAIPGDSSPWLLVSVKRFRINWSRSLSIQAAKGAKRTGCDEACRTLMLGDAVSAYVNVGAWEFKD